MNERETLVKQIVSVGADKLLALTVMRLLADDTGIVTIPPQELGALMGVTPETIKRRISALEIDGYVTRLKNGKLMVATIPDDVSTALCVKPDVARVAEQASTADVSVSGSDVTTAWGRQYRAAYDQDYKWGTWVITKNLAKGVADRYGAHAITMIDVLFRNWNVWKTANYQRPVIQMLSAKWLGDQLFEYAKTQATTGETSEQTLTGLL